MRCVSCGKTEAVADYVCEGCYLKRHEPKLPREIQVCQCPGCDLWKGRGAWTDDALAACRGALGFKSSQFEVAGLRFDDDVLTVSLRSIVKDVPIEITREVKVRTNHATCPGCSRSSGGYYEATLQVRGERVLGVVSEIRSMIERTKAPNAFVAKEEEVRGGVDLQIGSWKVAEHVAREMASRHGAEFKSSRKLHTRKDNKDVYRMSYLVRLPSIGKGDIFEHEGAVYVYLNPSGKATHARALATGEEARLQVLASDLTHIARASDARGAIVVSETEKEVQVLDPGTMMTIELPRPASIKKGELAEKKEVKIIDVRGEPMIYLE